MTAVLDLIDDTLTDWHTSRDAMHWTAVRAGSRVDYLDLDPAEQEELHAWVLAHGIVLRQVPVDGLIELDDSIPVPEWRVEVYALRDGRPYLSDKGDDSPVRRVVRRVSRGPLPWPTSTAAGSESR